MLSKAPGVVQNVMLMSPNFTLHTHTRTYTHTLSLSRKSSANKVYIEAEVRQPCQKRPIYTKRDQYIPKGTNIYQKRRIDSKRGCCARRAAMRESPSQIMFVIRLFCGSLFVYIGLFGHFGRTSAPRSRRQIVFQQKACRFFVVYFGRKKAQSGGILFAFRRDGFFCVGLFCTRKTSSSSFSDWLANEGGPSYQGPPSFISRTALKNPIGAATGVSRRWQIQIWWWQR